MGEEHEEQRETTGWIARFVNYTGDKLNLFVLLTDSLELDSL